MIQSNLLHRERPELKAQEAKEAVAAASKGDPTETAAAPSGGASTQTASTPNAAGSLATASAAGTVTLNAAGTPTLEQTPTKQTAEEQVPSTPPNAGKFARLFDFHVCE